MAVWYAVGCNAVGLAVPPNERSDFWGRAKRGVPDAAKPIRYHHAYARVGGVLSLAKLKTRVKS